MTKTEFLQALYEKLACLPPEDAEERVSFYGEMIDDRMDDGLSEEEAVAEIGTADEIAAQIIAEAPYGKFVIEKPKSGRRMRAWEIVLLVLGSPLWISLLLACFSVAISLQGAVWSVVISLWAAFVSVMLSALAGAAGGFVLAVWGHGITGAALTGAAVFCGGLGIFLLFACVGATKGSAWLTKKIYFGVKRCFAGREGAR